MENRLATIREQVEHAKAREPRHPLLHNDNLFDKLYLLSVIDKLSVDTGVIQTALQTIVDSRGQASAFDMWTIAKKALRETGE